ncbi:hypothetical protein [Sphingopyxis sp. KK2]|uniref:hypothetical protein n=1 Tax=Sphingopyxis sp. KK2 TaxID=1855727 RepID=UPI00097E7365|nr:hypothetical protein [Sphingopyxis sp. KK2]
MKRAAICAVILAATLTSCSYPALTVEACTRGHRLGFQVTLLDGRVPKIDRVAVGRRQSGTPLLAHVWAAYTPTNFWHHSPYRSELIYYGQVPDGWRADAKAPALTEGAAYEVWITAGKSEGSAAFSYGPSLPKCRSR